MLPLNRERALLIERCVCPFSVVRDTPGRGVCFCGVWGRASGREGHRGLLYLHASELLVCELWRHNNSARDLVRPEASAAMHLFNLRHLVASLSWVALLPLVFAAVPVAERAPDEDVNSAALRERPSLVP